MKKILSILVIILTITSFAEAKPKLDTLVVKTKIYCDHCTKCESCGPRIERAMQYVKGVKDMQLDAEAMTITVVYNTKKTNPEEIRKAISKAGFDADDVPADPEAYNKLDGCCKRKE